MHFELSLLFDETFVWAHEALLVLILAVKVVGGIIFYSIRALLPTGILPRKSLNGKIMLITGSGSGIGRLCALKFGKLGATVVLWDVNTAGNEETQLLLEEIGVKCFAYTVDLNQPDQIYETAEKVRRDIGDVQLLFNNAGVVIGKPLVELPDHLARLTMNVNANALITTTKAFLPAMLECNEGHIITLASLAGHFGFASLVDYCMSKYAAVGFAEALRRELFHLKSDIKTTCICPYFIDTGMFAGVGTSKFNWFLPILTPEYVVDRIVDTVLTEKFMLLLPRPMYLFKFLASFLPTEVGDMIQGYSAADKTMDTFVGRRTGDSFVKVAS